MGALGLLGLAAFILTLDNDSDSLDTVPGVQSNAYMWIRDLHPLLAGVSDTHVGLMCCFAASAMSGVAAALTQKALQSDRRNSYMYTIELAFFTIVALTTKTLMQVEDKSSVHDLVLKGWTLSAMIPVAVNAAGGICVGQVTKLAGGVRKSFSIVMGIILTAILDYVLLGIPLSMHVTIAVPLVGTSLVLHSRHPPSRSDRIAKKIQ
ncbi:hypothetical protein SARC_12619 [Sphaeroforma arctica JP610]|uniref:EamA domain-containing protein n=1 Tax=Sphaeroforma arctica JP610 TaxID=667725 RepID=A0A0L0FEC7_9EUKA|nr:hypothetical protein SARC_12619 [Sphaeroforma arctica JP610]KNC74841.1 hypothetical protein SARC_12619 [Sphaeroforma arctica JP610]|eukprot:XP_014148743.1 hypothetical protein SARC_12619 [Sphaeroforma arctica JP610]